VTLERTFVGLDVHARSEDTAELATATAAGGTGIAVCCDHSDPEQVAALVHQVPSQQGRLDILVNDIWGGDPLTEWAVASGRHWSCGPPGRSPSGHGLTLPHSRSEACSR